MMMSEVAPYSHAKKKNRTKSNSWCVANGRRRITCAHFSRLSTQRKPKPMCVDSRGVSLHFNFFNIIFFFVHSSPLCCGECNLCAFNSVCRFEWRHHLKNDLRLNTFDRTHVNELVWFFICFISCPTSSRVLLLYLIASFFFSIRCNSWYKWRMKYFPWFKRKTNRKTIEGCQREWNGRNVCSSEAPARSLHFVCSL